MCKIVQNVQKCAKCAKLCRAGRDDRADRADWATEGSYCPEFETMTDRPTDPPSDLSRF